MLFVITCVYISIVLLCLCPTRLECIAFLSCNPKNAPAVWHCRRWRRRQAHFSALSRCRCPDADVLQSGYLLRLAGNVPATHGIAPTHSPDGTDFEYNLGIIIKQQFDYLLPFVCCPFCLYVHDCETLLIMLQNGK